MRLSDAFILKEEHPALDMKVRFFNINYGKSPEIMAKCQSLSEYSTFVFYVRENQKKGMPLNEAIAQAVKQAICDGIMRDFLREHGSEVENMLFEEWKWEEYAAAQKAEGREESRTEIVLNMAKTLDPKDIAALTKIPLPVIEKILAANPA